MFCLSHSRLYSISAVVWLLIGCFLLNRGLGLLANGFTSFEGYSSLFVWIASIAGGFENAALLFIILALVVGYVKGRIVLHKVALESGARIASFENPTSIKNLYSLKNWLVMGLMVLLGSILRYFEVPYDVRGFFAAAVGMALLQGSLTFFSLAKRVGTAK
jgi:hypothetical protein